MTTNEPPAPRVVPQPPETLRKDWLFVVVLSALAALIAILWFADPTHQPQGESRVDWPVAPGKL
jgi:hypothetical protein